MARMSFGKKGSRVEATTTGPKPAGERSVEEVVREMKEGMQKPPGEDYRERSLAIHGLICAAAPGSSTPRTGICSRSITRTATTTTTPPTAAIGRISASTATRMRTAGSCWATTTTDRGQRKNNLVHSGAREEPPRVYRVWGQTRGKPSKKKGKRKIAEEAAIDWPDGISKRYGSSGNL